MIFIINGRTFKLLDINMNVKSIVIYTEMVFRKKCSSFIEKYLSKHHSFVVDRRDDVFGAHLHLTHSIVFEWPYTKLRHPLPPFHIS